MNRSEMLRCGAIYDAETLKNAWARPCTSRSNMTKKHAAAVLKLLCKGCIGVYMMSQPPGEKQADLDRCW